jgi:methylmalonyl-CoA/ethylmalonyl-CoA epimerase
MKTCDMILGVRHIGIYVNDLDDALAQYKKIYDIADEQIRQVPPPGTPDPQGRFAFIPIGGTEFELIQTVSEEFKQMVGNPPPGINHIAFTVSDIEKAVQHMQAKGIRLGHVTADGILDMHSSRVAYFNPQDTGGILIEFVEPARNT